MADQVFCRYCGQKMPVDSQYCPECGRFQGGPAAQPGGDARPSYSPTAAQAPLAASGKARAGGKIPLFVWAIGAVLALCCLGLAVAAAVGSSLLKSPAPPRTEAAAQTGLAEKWTAPLLALYIVEQQYRDSIATFEQIEAGSLTRDEFTTQLSNSDAYDVVFIGFFRLEELPAEGATEEDALKVDPSVQPFVDSLEDDFENVAFTEMAWAFEDISLDEAVDKLRQGQQALSIEGDRMIQAARSEGMTDEVYATIQASLEREWPQLKARFTDIGIRMMTPEP
jgi:hypothetical protein